jgi:hypothetical protein
MSDALEQARQAALAELARTPKARPWWVDALGLAVVNVGVGLALLALFPSHSEQHASALWRVVTAAALVTVAGLGAVAAVRPEALSLRWSALVMAGVSAAGTLVGASGVGAKGVWGGAACTVFEVLSAVVPLALATWALSRFAADPLRAAVAGLAASAGGLLALHFTCPIGTLQHLGVFHLVPWLFIALVSLGIRRLVGSATWAP